MKAESEKLQLWFGLSHATWLTIPRVLMEDMSIDWQNKMADLLDEYENDYPNIPVYGTRVSVSKGSKLVKMPDWLNYRHPDHETIKSFKEKP